MRLQYIAAAAAALVVLVGVSAFAAEYRSTARASRAKLPEVVKLAAGSFEYRASGSFARDGTSVDAPKVEATIPGSLAIMVHQVTAGEYRRCVEAKVCAIIDYDANTSGRPAVKLSWRDASSYATWLSRETGVHFRLPTDAEWAYAAGSRFKDDALPRGFDNRNAGRRELAIYEREADSADGLDQRPQPLGTFGANEHGVIDLAGNVWEWTDTCFTRNTVDERGDAQLLISSCGVRAVEGRHRAYVADFIRDARGGGCAVGTPPTNLGFRLVRDDPSAGPWHQLLQLMASSQRFFGFSL